MKIGFFETEDWEAEYLKSRLAGHQLFFSQEAITKDKLPVEKDFEAISIFTGSMINQEVLAALPNLKFIVTRTTGYDHIDLKATQDKNILISNVPSYGENTVAEFAFGLLLCLSRKIFLAYDQIRETGSFALKGLQGFDLKDKTLGIVGTGRIGQNMIKIAHGFEMKVIAYDVASKPELEKELGFKYVSFEELLKNSDIISLHVPYLKSTHHLINKENIKFIKTGAVLINTSRGGVVETDALIQALNNGILAGAGLDVLEEEAPTKDERQFLLYGRPDEHNLKTILQNHVLIDMDNVIITPHNAFNTKEALERILKTTIENIVGFIQKKPQNLII